MKRFIVAALLALTISSTACTSNTQYGHCKGIIDVNEEDPHLRYETSTLNVVLGVIFFETVFAPILAFGFDMYCPEGTK